VVIRTLKAKDIESLVEMLTQSIANAFINEGLAGLYDDVINEIYQRFELAMRFINTSNTSDIFLVAINNGEVIGSIVYKELNKDIKNNINVNHGIKEVGTIYVKPNYQNQGVATLLINAMIEKLISLEVNEFMLDCGFKTAQQVWTNKFGKPYKVLKDYWPSGSDYYVWRVKNIKRYIK